MDKPLIVQSDRTLLLDVHNPSAEECREQIIAFAELIKSPEHMHTYQISALSLWNARSSGLGCENIIARLKKYSRFDIPERVEFYITDIASRFGSIILEPMDDEHYLLTVTKSLYARQIGASQLMAKYLTRNTESTFLVPLLLRGEVKLQLTNLGFPVDDRIPLTKGEPISIKRREKTRGGVPFIQREYQKQAVASLLGNGEPGTGYGTIVLPCGSGKTIVGIEAMCALQTRTLILAPNVASVHQWIAEIKDKTTIGDDEIGEYTGECKEIKPITVCTYQVLTWRPDKEGPFPHFGIFKSGNWGFIIYDEVHMLPAPVFKVTAELQAVRRLGLTATLIREDGRENEVFSLVGPKRFDVPWSELERQGFIATAYCHEVRLPLPEELEIPYALASKKEKYRIASENPLKIKASRQIILAHPDDQILIIGQYIDQLKLFQKEFKYPLITGTTSNAKRDMLYDAFRSGKEKVLIVSKVANFAIDLPDASLAIQISGTFGSRQEEAQRLGRILRPKARDSHFYTLITRYSSEEEFAQNRQKFLSEQGYSYDVENVEEL